MHGHHALARRKKRSRTIQTPQRGIEPPQHCYVRDICLFLQNRFNFCFHWLLQGLVPFSLSHPSVDGPLPSSTST